MLCLNWGYCFKWKFIVRIKPENISVYLIDYNDLKKAYTYEVET